MELSKYRTALMPPKNARIRFLGRVNWRRKMIFARREDLLEQAANFDPGVKKSGIASLRVQHARSYMLWKPDVSELSASKKGKWKVCELCPIGGRYTVNLSREAHIDEKPVLRLSSENVLRISLNILAPMTKLKYPLRRALFSSFPDLLLRYVLKRRTQS